MSYDYSTGRIRLRNLANEVAPGGTYTLTNADIGSVFRNDSASNLTVVVPGTLIGGFSAGFIQYSTGTITLSTTLGSVNQSAKTATSAQFARGSVLVAKQNAAETAAEFLVGGDFA
jgi:hypothetical protein